MRRWAILGAVALSFAVAAAAEARPRFGPGTILRALPAPFGAMFGGFRAPGSRQLRRARTERPAPPRPREVARVEQPAAQIALVGWSGQAFWPQAFDDLLESLVDGTGARFWSHGYGDMLDGMFAASAAKPPDVAAAAQPCGASTNGTSTDGAADRWIERLERALQPTTEQRRALAELRDAMVTASERIATACRTTPPATPPQRLEAMQDRLWAMRDGALTLRVPLENLDAQLTNEQKARLAGGQASARGTGEPAATEGRGGGAARICGQQAAAITEWPAQAIERTVRPADQQRPALEALRMLSMGMGQLLMTSCPSAPPAEPLGRLAVATERITVMLFAVKTTSAALDGVYDSLTDEQKTAFNKLARQQQRRLAGGS